MKKTAMNHLKSAPATAWHLFWRLKWRFKIALAVLVMAVLSGVAIEVTAQPGFCNSCHIMNTYYASWQTSGHADVKCLECHFQPGLAAYVKGKINGLAQAVDCAVGRVGTKPSATVDDASCLRSDCHDVEELKVDQLSHGGVRFTHGNHVEKTVGGITLSCGTCHSHFEGQEHFTVNKEVCFTCHVERTAKTTGTLDSFGTVARAVPSACDTCHEAGTGQQYVPFWQQKIKSLYDQMDRKVKQLEDLAGAQTDEARAQELGRRAREARSILDSILFDGSWGAHNFKYTEALLLEVDKAISNGVNDARK